MSDIPSENDSLLTFPTEFPIKVFGLDNDDFIDAIKAIIERQVNSEHLLNWRQNESKKGNYVAITITIMATSQLQLDAIYQALTDCQLVKMAL